MIVLSILTLLVLLPAGAAYLSETGLLSRKLLTPVFGIGNAVVYQEQQISTHPSAEAYDIHPSERGEFYYYSLINYLRVTHILDDGRIIAITPDNRRFCFWPNDPQLRKPRLKERFIYRWRFPHLSA